MVVVHAVVLAVSVWLILFASTGSRGISRRIRSPRRFRVALLVLGALGVLDSTIGLIWEGVDVAPDAFHAATLGGWLTLGGGLVALCSIDWIRKGETAYPRRILAVGSHPDDLELACGGTLARLVDSGHEVHGVRATAVTISAGRPEWLAFPSETSGAVAARSDGHDYLAEAIDTLGQGGT